MMIKAFWAPSTPLNWAQTLMQKAHHLCRLVHAHEFRRPLL